MDSSPVIAIFLWCFDEVYYFNETIKLLYDIFILEIVCA